MIKPYAERALSEGRSYGLSSAGYDIRIAQTVWVWPLWGRLASAIERIKLPSWVAAELKDKSTNARIFVLVQNTIFEPGWTGYPTLELTRLKPWPIRIKKGTPIGQVIFKLLDEPTDAPYRGKYDLQGPKPQPAIFE
jgi:dCTP deaminase